MKKVFIILNLFLLIIALSCASSSSLQNDSVNDSSSFNFINLKNVRGAQKVDIYRKNLTNEEETSSCKISSPYKKGYKVMDYFTNPGEEYSYRVLYYKGSKILKTDEITIEAKNGVGEIDTPNNINSTFNSSFGTMTTSKPASFTKTINDFLKPKYDDGWWGDKSFEAIYTSSDNNELKVEIPLYYTWDCSDIIKERPELYGKELKREYVIGFIYLYKDNSHNLKYYQLIDDEKSKDVPMNITINNIDKSFTVTQVDEGLQINIPVHLKGFTKVSINRKNNTTGKQVYDYIVWEQANDETESKYTFIDKHVNVNDSYSYQIALSDENGDLYVSKALGSDSRQKFIALNGLGESTK